MMKRRICIAGIAVLALLLSLTGCGAERPAGDAAGGGDGPGGAYAEDGLIDLPVAPPEEDPAPEEDDAPEEDPTPEEGPAPEDPGTTDGGERLYEDPSGLDEDGTYNSAEDVSLYLHTYGHLPENYITKSEARDLGWTGGSVERYAPGCAIGGDKFGNREGVLPKGTYHECDIDTIGESSRGAKRLVYADDGRIYYTEDHYETFTLLYGEE